MNFYTLMKDVVLSSLKKVIPGITLIQIPGLAGTWFQLEGSPISFFVRESSEGDFILKVSISNIYVPTETFVFSDPIDLVELINSKLSEWKEIPVEGRTWSKAEDYERNYGSLTGVDFEKEFGIEDEEKVSFDDAITESPIKSLALI